jgi:hypothetical protein
MAGKRLESASSSGGLQLATFNLLRTEFNAQLSALSDQFQQNSQAARRLAPFADRYYKAAQAYDAVAEVWDISNRFARCRISGSSKTCRSYFDDYAAKVEAHVFLAGLGQACNVCDVVAPQTVSQVLGRAVELNLDADAHLTSSEP